MHSLYKYTHNLSNINSKHRIAAMFVNCRRTSDILYTTSRALTTHLRTKVYISSCNGSSVTATKSKTEKIFCKAIIVRAINQVPQEELAYSATTTSKCR